MLDKNACPMPVLGRADVDVPALKMFETIALDVQATRQHLAGQLDTRAADAMAQAARADRDVAEKRAALARFAADYAAGELGAGNYERLTAEYTEQLAAAEEEHEQLVAHAGHIDRTLGSLDAEGRR